MDCLHRFSDLPSFDSQATRNALRGLNSAAFSGFSDICFSSTCSQVDRVPQGMWTNAGAVPLCFGAKGFHKPFRSIAAVVLGVAQEGLRSAHPAQERAIRELLPRGRRSKLRELGSMYGARQSRLRALPHSQPPFRWLALAVRLARSLLRPPQTRMALLAEQPLSSSQR